MKKKIAWIIDTTGFVTEEFKAHPDVYAVPLNIHFGTEEFIDDGVDLTNDELYQRMKESADFPKTSQPSAGKFSELYDKLKEEYECAIAVHASAKLSGTIASSTAGAEMSEFKVYAVDSLALSYGLSGLIERGLKLQEQGVDAEEIAQRLEKETANFRNYILIGNLSQLYKGGRMSGAQYYLGSLLQIKPIVQLTPEGELKPIDKVRSHKKAIQYLINHAKKDYEEYGVRRFQIMHGHVMKEAESLKQEVLKQMPEATILIGDLSSSLAVHAGEGTLAFLWRREDL
ncbi:DegV family protein [Planococcus antarcticus DSM 14505]|uniref:DegV family protein n=1 Tax=Planococcus antarcticus DSM 14505 TaxID=1185653 RepID=A0A1C7DEX7_9BACL|nr:DegV family protein [Planococcus antarcticus]ANU09967.1 fatty acid-binding protein DegV [Planococcus antarcticus DSM 14505]EIM07477.1 DegV family protein [Planococcus antarcticus DSM 14505]